MDRFGHSRPFGFGPTIPGDLRIIVARCLEKDPDRRYDSARLLAEDLDRFLAGEPILARPPSLLYRARKRMGRLERERETLGTVAAGPGSFALGASALPLGELEEARRLAGTQDGAGDPASAP